MFIFYGRVFSNYLVYVLMLIWLEFGVLIEYIMKEGLIL